MSASSDVEQLTLAFDEEALCTTTPQLRECMRVVSCAADKATCLSILLQRPRGDWSVALRSILVHKIRDVIMSDFMNNPPLTRVPGTLADIYMRHGTCGAALDFAFDRKALLHFISLHSGYMEVEMVKHNASMSCFMDSCNLKLEYMQCENQNLASQLHMERTKNTGMGFSLNAMQLELTCQYKLAGNNDVDAVAQQEGVKMVVDQSTSTDDGCEEEEETKAETDSQHEGGSGSWSASDETVDYSPHSSPRAAGPGTEQLSLGVETRTQTEQQHPLGSGMQEADAKGGDANEEIARLGAMLQESAGTLQEAQTERAELRSLLTVRESEKKALQAILDNVLQNKEASVDSGQLAHANKKIALLEQDIREQTSRAREGGEHQKKIEESNFKSFTAAWQQKVAWRDEQIREATVVKTDLEEKLHAALKKMEQLKCDVSAQKVKNSTNKSLDTEMRRNLEKMRVKVEDTAEKLSKAQEENDSLKASSKLMQVCAS